MRRKECNLHYKSTNNKEFTMCCGKSQAKIQQQHEVRLEFGNGKHDGDEDAITDKDGGGCSY